MINRITDNKFKLVSKYQPSGDQPQAIEQLVDNIEGGEKAQILMGATGTGKTYTMSQVISKVNKPTLVIAHNKTLAGQLYGEFKEFFPENAVEYFVSYYEMCIRDSIKRVVPEAPHETFLALDASTGQNALVQAKEFSKITPLTGIVLTKIDGTARGGVVLAIREELNIPVKLIGFGEKIDDIGEFNSENFMKGLLEGLI